MESSGLRRSARSGPGDLRRYPRWDFTAKSASAQNAYMAAGAVHRRPTKIDRAACGAANSGNADAVILRIRIILQN